MFGGCGDPHIPQSILSFTPDYVRAIYLHIFELIPCLEVHPEWCFDECWKDIEDCNIVNDEAWLNKRKELNRKWLKYNSFKAARIDFTYDLYAMNQQYLALIDKGYSLRTNSFKRNYYDNDESDISENEITLSDEEPDMPDIEDFLKEISNDESDDSDNKANTNTSDSDLSYIYYKSKSLNINIYHKQTELEKRQLAFDPDTDYDFLRIEMQVKKSKLNTLVRKHSLNGRELQYLVIPEVEQYVLDYYVNKLTGTGLYVTYDRAMKMIDESGYTKPKKERLKKIIEAVAKKHGIAKVLEQVENGIITNLGKLSTVKQYLREIHNNIGINPVTISARMEVPKLTLKSQDGGKDISEKILPNLVDILSAYGDQMKDYQQHGIPLTDEDIEKIMEL